VVVVAAAAVVVVVVVRWMSKRTSPQLDLTAPNE
jgi:hypothetical protein